VPSCAFVRFGLFDEHQLPRPWREDSEYRLLRDALEQIEIADRAQALNELAEKEERTILESLMNHLGKLGAKADRTRDWMAS
jgi:hypothetical protein